jgi:hypothetical protein
METQSQDPTSRRQRGNRSGGRSRNRQGNQSTQGNNGSSGRNRSRRRNRSGNRSGQPPKQTTVQKILSILTFGLLGKPSAGQARKSAQNPAQKPARKPETDKPAPSAKSTSARTTPDDSRKTKRNRAEVTSGRLYVGNLDYSTGEAELTDLFKGVGNVIRAEVVTNPRTQQSKGFAFVEMGSLDEAKRAVSILDDQEFMGRKLIVSGARTDGPGDESGESAMAGSAREENA